MKFEAQKWQSVRFSVHIWRAFTKCTGWAIVPVAGSALLRCRADPAFGSGGHGLQSASNHRTGWRVARLCASRGWRVPGGWLPG